MSCPICTELIQRPGSIDCCVHKFCFPCIDRWLRVNNTCPLCKATVTRLNGENATKPIHPPRVDYATNIANYLFGPARNVCPRLPYEQQPNLPGFVSFLTTDEILTAELQEASGNEEPMRCSLQEADYEPVYTRTRQRSKPVNSK